MPNLCWKEVYLTVAAWWEWRLVAEPSKCIKVAISPPSWPSSVGSTALKTSQGPFLPPGSVLLPSTPPPFLPTFVALETYYILTCVPRRLLRAHLASSPLPLCHSSPGSLISRGVRLTEGAPTGSSHRETAATGRVATLWQWHLVMIHRLSLCPALNATTTTTTKNSPCEKYERNHTERLCERLVLTFWSDACRVKGQICRHREQIWCSLQRRQRGPSPEQRIYSKCRRGVWVNGLQRGRIIQWAETTACNILIWIVSSGEWWHLPDWWFSFYTSRLHAASQMGQFWPGRINKAEIINHITHMQEHHVSNAGCLKSRRVQGSVGA